MNPIDRALTRLRAGDTLARAGLDADDPFAAALRASGVGFAAVGSSHAAPDGAHHDDGLTPGIEARWHAAVAELRQCIAETAGTVMLREGGAYPGAWLESTVTISGEVLDRFAPEVTRATHLAFAAAQRSDGLLPYKITADGPAFSQVQMATPLARSVWRHSLRAPGDRTYLRTMYDAMARHDAWLAAHRDTRGSGGVEAFCTFDTGHDGSPRFHGVPDRCPDGDAARYDTGIPALPFIAPDLTANVACQREYLALIAAALGDDPRPWRDRAAASRAALQRECRPDPDSAMYYDRATDGSHVRVDSDVLLRVHACAPPATSGPFADAEFADALAGHLMHTGRFFSAAGFTSIAMDDPGFDDDHTRNSWAGPVNALTMLRAPDAFEAHGRFAELAQAHRTLLAAMAGHDRFAQCYAPATAEAGYTDTYSPSILLYLDLIERDAGILPRPDGTVWLSGLIPTGGAPEREVRATASARRIGTRRLELAGDDARVEVHRDGVRWLEFPHGWRVVLDATGEPVQVVGLAANPVTGRLTIDGHDATGQLTLHPNDRVRLRAGDDAPRAGRSVSAPSGPGFTPPHA